MGSDKFDSAIAGLVKHSWSKAMPAIETTYKGCRFRSRLEARWAVFFDALGLEWKYELEGYEVDGHRYLPDFWLPAARAWAEVKGDPEGLRNDFDRMSAILGPKSPLPGFIEGKAVLVVLGDVPEARAGRVILHPVLHREHQGELHRVFGSFVSYVGGQPADLCWDQAPHSLLTAILGMSDKIGGEPTSPRSAAWNVDARCLDFGRECAGVSDAYRAARAARFEHGESGAPAPAQTGRRRTFDDWVKAGN